jgi:hypothetical protein
MIHFQNKLVLGTERFVLGLSKSQRGHGLVEEGL